MQTDQCRRIHAGWIVVHVRDNLRSRRENVRLCKTVIGRSGRRPERNDVVTPVAGSTIAGDCAYRDHVWIIAGHHDALCKWSSVACGRQYHDSALPCLLDCAVEGIDEVWDGWIGRQTEVQDTNVERGLVGDNVLDALDHCFVA